MLPSSNLVPGYIFVLFFFVSKIGHESISKDSWLHLGDLRGERELVSVAVDLA